MARAQVGALRQVKLAPMSFSTSQPEKFPAMAYRRFGRTELAMPVFSCGGMRYQQGWGDLKLEEITAENQANLEACIHRSLELGINHIETARGYGSSELQLGQILPTLNREKLIVQTKVAPAEDPAQFTANLEKSFSLLKLDYIDLFSFHGVNTGELLSQVLRPGGCMEVVRQWQKDGRIRFVGYSTHGSCELIKTANASGEFDYHNLHWYFVNELNWPAIEEATRQDMGVFIISPTDKGGKLYDPPSKLTELCRPLSPIAFNDLWCLTRPEVHTLSVGVARPEDFDEHVLALQHYEDREAVVAPIAARLNDEVDRTWGQDWRTLWPQNLPEHYDIPGDINVREILRLLTYARALDMVEWGKMRYNLLGNAGHWFPGKHVADLDEQGWQELGQALRHHPLGERVPTLLREAHALLLGEEKKRLSES